MVESEARREDGTPKCEANIYIDHDTDINVAAIFTQKEKAHLAFSYTGSYAACTYIACMQYKGTDALVTHDKVSRLSTHTVAYTLAAPIQPSGSTSTELR